MDKWKMLTHLNNNPGTEYVSKCGNYIIDESRKHIVWQQSYPVLGVNFSGIPDSVQWKIKK